MSSSRSPPTSTPPRSVEPDSAPRTSTSSGHPKRSFGSSAASRAIEGRSPAFDYWNRQGAFATTPAFVKPVSSSPASASIRSRTVSSSVSVGHHGSRTSTSSGQLSHRSGAGGSGSSGGVGKGSVEQSMRGVGGGAGAGGGGSAGMGSEKAKEKGAAFAFWHSRAGVSSAVGPASAPSAPSSSKPRQSASSAGTRLTKPAPSPASAPSPATSPPAVSTGPSSSTSPSTSSVAPSMTSGSSSSTQTQTGSGLRDAGKGPAYNFWKGGSRPFGSLSAAPSDGSLTGTSTGTGSPVWTPARSGTPSVASERRDSEASGGSAGGGREGSPAGKKGTESGPRSRVGSAPSRARVSSSRSAGNPSTAPVPASSQVSASTRGREVLKVGSAEPVAGSPNVTATVGTQGAVRATSSTVPAPVRAFVPAPASTTVSSSTPASASTSIESTSDPSSPLPPTPPPKMSPVPIPISKHSPKTGIIKVALADEVAGSTPSGSGSYATYPSNSPEALTLRSPPRPQKSLARPRHLHSSSQSSPPPPQPLALPRTSEDSGTTRGALDLPGPEVSKGKGKGKARSRVSTHVPGTRRGGSSFASHGPAREATLADQGTYLRDTKGQIPPPLVGASVTVVGSTMYVFGGRFVWTRSMTSDLYALDLDTLVWQRIWPRSEDDEEDGRRDTLRPGTVLGKGKGKEVVRDDEDAPSSSRKTDEARAKDLQIPAEDTAFEAAQRPSGPKPRYFHSAEAWGDHHLIFFGGMGAWPPAPDEGLGGPTTPVSGSDAESSEDTTIDINTKLCVLGDLFLFDLHTKEWVFPNTEVDDGVLRPSPRYAHLGCVTEQWASPRNRLPPESDARSRAWLGDGSSDQDGDVGRGTGTIRRRSSSRSRRRSSSRRRGRGLPRHRSLFVLCGGQNIQNQYVHELNVLDLRTMRWVERRKVTSNYGTYRSVACTPRMSVRWDEERVRRKAGHRPTKGRAADNEELGRNNWSELPSLERPEPLYLYSNFHLQDVQRDLEIVSFPNAQPPAVPLSLTGQYSTVHRLSSTMAGETLPPGLRFPSGAIIGSHLVVAGTFVTSQTKIFAIWALDLAKGHADLALNEPQNVDSRKGSASSSPVDPVAPRRLPTLIWRHLDPGYATKTGSWGRACAWGNKLVITGDYDRMIADDYQKRQLNFAHVLIIDLESFGIYQPPVQVTAPIEISRLGLRLLYTPILGDLEVLCADGRVIMCSSKILEARWPWFRERMRQWRIESEARRATIQQSTSNGALAGSDRSGARSDSSDDPPPPRLSMPHSSIVMLALFQYLYARNLCTPLHHDVAVLAQLLLLAESYDMADLKILTVHAIHTALNRLIKEGSSTHAAGVQGSPRILAMYTFIFEAATLAGCPQLLVRCLKALYAPSNRSAVRLSRAFYDPSLLRRDYDDPPTTYSATASDQEAQEDPYARV